MTYKNIKVTIVLKYCQERINISLKIISIKTIGETFLVKGERMKYNRNFRICGCHMLGVKDLWKPMNYMRLFSTNTCTATLNMLFNEKPTWCLEIYFSIIPSMIYEHVWVFHGNSITCLLQLQCIGKFKKHRNSSFDKFNINYQSAIGLTTITCTYSWHNAM